MRIAIAALLVRPNNPCGHFTATLRVLDKEQAFLGIEMAIALQTVTRFISLTIAIAITLLTQGYVASWSVVSGTVDVVFVDPVPSNAIHEAQVIVESACFIAACLPPHVHLVRPRTRLVSVPVIDCPPNPDLEALCEIRLRHEPLI